MLVGGSQAKVMNLVEVITASRFVGATGTLCRTTEDPPIRDNGRVVVTKLESAVMTKINQLRIMKTNKLIQNPLNQDRKEESITKEETKAGVNRSIKNQ